MPVSSQDGLPGEEDHFLSSLSYPMHLLTDGNPRYTNEIDDDASPYLDTPESRIPEALEEGCLTVLKPIVSDSGLPVQSVSRIYYAVSRWIRGPRPSRPYRLKPILPQLQSVPLDWLRRRLRRRQERLWLLAIAFILWAVVFLSLLSYSILGCQVSGYKGPVRLSCVSRFW